MTNAYDAHGTRFRITSSVDDVVNVFDELLVDMRAPGAAAGDVIELEPVGGTAPAGGGSDHPDRLFGVRFGDELVHARLREGSLVSHVLMEVNRRAALSVWSSGAIPLHASAAGVRTGTVVLPGVSRSGKTTLAVALAVGDDETSLVADELCALDPHGLVVSTYGKPAALRSPGSDLFTRSVVRLQRPGSRFELDERFVPPSELGGRSSATTPIVAVVFPRFDPSINTPGSGESSLLTSVGPVDALVRLMRMTLGDAPDGRGVFRALERLVRGVPTYDLVFTDAIEASQQLRATLSGHIDP